MNKKIIMAKARLSLLYFTSELIYQDIRQCDDVWELEDYLELYEIIKEWSFILELKIQNYEIDKKIFPEREEVIEPKLDKAMNTFCVLGEDCILSLAEFMNEHEENHVSRMFAWLYVPLRNIKNLLLLSELLSLLDLKVEKHCKHLRQYRSLIGDAIMFSRKAIGCAEDLQF